MKIRAQDGTAWVFALLPGLLSAQTINPSASIGAQIFQQVQAPTSPRPSSLTPIRVENTSSEGAGNPFPTSDSFLLQRLDITHNTLFDTAALLALVADAQGKLTTLSALNELAARLTHFYRIQGYPLSRVIVPAQTISKALGVVSLRVVEASYDLIELDNTSRVRSSLLQATLAPLKEGHVVVDVPLNHVLLLLSDIPGTDITAIYKPGQRESTSTLTVAVKPSRMVSGNVTVDNFGTDETGHARLSSGLTLANPFKQGDTIQLSTLHSGAGLSHWRLAYEATLNGQGTRAGVSFSRLDYALKFGLLNATGTATSRSLWAKHPMVRSPEWNLYAQAQYDGLQTHDRADYGKLQADRTLQSATLSLTGDARTGKRGGGTTTWRLAWTDGRLRSTDESTASGELLESGATRFAKWSLNVAHLERLGPKSALYLSYSAQRAQSELDPAQKLSAGGPFTVRAYPMGTISGDSGQISSAEWREELGEMSGQWQAVAFVDAARVTLSHASLATDNVVWLRGLGAGLNWRGPDQWTASLTFAKAMGEQPTLLVSNPKIRTWLEVRKGF